MEKEIPTANEIYIKISLAGNEKFHPLHLKVSHHLHPLAFLMENGRFPNCSLIGRHEAAREMLRSDIRYLTEIALSATINLPEIGKGKQAT